VDHAQRYCVNCGAHRRHVNDPAARYLSAATAQSRASVAPAHGRRPAGTRRPPSVALAALLAVIPAGVAVGVVVGRSSNNGDAQLIQELSRSQAQLAATSRASTATSTAATATTPVATQTSSARHKRAVKHKSSTKRVSARHTGSTATHPTKAPKNLSGQPSASQQQQGAAIVKRLQHTSGTSYLNQLPSQVVVP
jgi:hypothetical protein